MKIMTFNVRIWTRDTDSSANTYWKKRMARMEELISRENPDIICFQEMMFPATCYIPSGYKRVGISAHHSIFIKKNAGIKTRNHKFKIFYEYVDMDIQGFGEFKLFNVHPRWEENLAQKTFADLNNDIGDYRKCIVCGDFNANLEDARKNGLVGTSVREALGIEKKDTFQNYTKEYQHDEIDHFILNRMPLPKSYKIASDYDVSDHKSVVIEY